jgi:DUF4097 and DUF4098 domain-containing protein YvlB
MKLAIALIIPLTLCGQMRDNRDKELTCQGWGYGGQVHHCDIREQSFASTGRIVADASRNGGVTIKGWLRNDVLVRSQVDVWADSDAEANARMSQIHIDTSSGQVSASGPAEVGRGGWAVSYEIFVPRVSSVEAKARNGGISVSDVEGTMHLETSNGGIHLARVAGDLTGETTNGGIHAELMGNTWYGRQLELSTKNGGIAVSMPDGYSAHVQAETVHGGIVSDFPMTVTGRIRPQNLDTTLGSGGPLIHLSTVNGGVSLKRG